MASGLIRPGDGPDVQLRRRPRSSCWPAPTATGPYSAAEMVIPAGFRGPIPHAHDTFDEALYVIDGTILAGVGLRRARLRRRPDRC